MSNDKLLCSIRLLQNLDFCCVFLYLAGDCCYYSHLSDYDSKKYKKDCRISETDSRIYKRACWQAGLKTQANAFRDD